ncbi:MAG TPA: hypothetical protein VMH83_14065 [Candidatus Acidoferrum sp.]|nr:hypothetical protein [Candidatus Acidoferrum sp.]
MKRPVRLLFSLCVALCCGTAALAHAQQAVTAQELKQVRASGKVITALWTSRGDSYTLQLVFAVTPTSRNMKPPTANQPASAPEPVQVKLLRADGTSITPLRQWGTSVAPKPCIRCTPPELVYTFAPADGKQAVLADIRIGDAVFLEQLEPL